MRSKKLYVYVYSGLILFSDGKFCSEIHNTLEKVLEDLRREEYRIHSKDRMGVPLEFFLRRD